MSDVARNGLTWFSVLIGALAFTVNTDSWAGDPLLDLEYTNMTPNEFSDEASKLCSGRLKAALRATASDRVRVSAVGEAARRKQVGAKGGGDFTLWGREAIPMDDSIFAVLADCRPKEQRLDVLLVGNETSVVFRLRHQPLTEARIRWLAEDVSLRMSAMFWE